MFSYFPLSSSVEKIPQPRRCDSLRLASIVTALSSIFYSMLALHGCTRILVKLPPYLSTEDRASMLWFGVVIIATIVNAVLLLLSTFLLFGVAKEKKFWIRPWVTWMSIEVTFLLLMFIFWSTMNMITQYGNSSLGDYLLEFFALLIKFYMLTIVMNYYKQLEDAEENSEKMAKLMSSEVWKV